MSQPNETITTREVSTERESPSGRWQDFLSGFATDGGRQFLSALYEAGHILISFIVLLIGIWMVAKGIDYGKEVASVAGGWLGRSMVGPTQKEKP